MAGHVQELGRLDGRARRQYVELNAEAIVFDTHALLTSLKICVEYQALRAAVTRAQNVSNESGVQLFDRITRSTPPEIEESFEEIGQLTESFVASCGSLPDSPDGRQCH